ncbi:KPN_02809 family neutral zinc metallopeptidase [Nocardioides sp. MAHUQ-72]|uniref:KPN_02809 family neutral zinc metallopeptidase n=1 Tax=unclassified Nocardioides TaxID=2615069 RepID=UPI00361CD802
MRFNPKARLDTSRMGDAGRGRRGGGLGGGGGAIPIPGGMKAGGGIGGVIIVVLFIVLTQCLNDGGSGSPAGGGDLDSSRMADTGRYDGCRTGADANESEDCARVAVENSLYAYWSATLPDQSSTDFRPEKQVETFTDAVGTGCGQATSEVGPFYCPVDRTIYLDTTFFDAVLEKQLDGPSGAFVEPYVLAHEYGHHVQNLLGTMGRVKTQQGPQSDSVRLELQADCYAGMWAKSATTTDDATGEPLFSSLTDADIQQAIAAATAVGDDRIQQETGGRVNPEQWTHGSAASRVKWFRTGFSQGSLDACDTFATDNL